MTDYSELVKALRFETDYVAVEKTMRDAAAAIEELQVQLPKRGEWVYNDGDYIPYCSICGMPQDIETPYCYSCGAKMEVQDATN